MTHTAPTTKSLSIGPGAPSQGLYDFHEDAWGPATSSKSAWARQSHPSSTPPAALVGEQPPQKETTSVGRCSQRREAGCRTERQRTPTRNKVAKVRYGRASIARHTRRQSAETISTTPDDQVNQAQKHNPQARAGEGQPEPRRKARKSRTPKRSVASCGRWSLDDPKARCEQQAAAILMCAHRRSACSS